MKLSDVTFKWAWGLAAVASVAAAEDWPNFRGPRHDGISRETDFQVKWDKPIPLAWEHNVGSAYSSFACVDGRLYTCGTADDKQVLYCFDAQSGKVLWQAPIEREYPNNWGSGTRATPAVDDGRVYILGALGRLVCFDAKTGKEIWSHPFNHQPEWGYSGSVLIEGDVAVSSGGNDDGALIAFDKKTGQVKWKTGDDPAGYSTPYPFTFENERYLVGFNGNAALIVHAENGKQAARIPWETSYKVNAAAPIFHEGHLFLTSGYQTGCGLYKLTKDGGRLRAEQVWKSDVLKNKFQSCILHEGHLYGSDQKALVCADFMTGKQRWSIPRQQNGTLILANGYLLFLTEKGELQIAKADPEKFEPITQAEILSDRCWVVPILCDGLLHARNLERVVCFNLRP